MLPVNDRDDELNTCSETIRKLIEKISKQNTGNGNYGKIFQDEARTLINIGGPEIVKLLIPFLSSEEPEKRTFAVDVLVRIGKDALPYLCGLMDNEDNDSDVRKIVLDIIRMIPAPESEEYLIRFLFDDDVNVAVAAAEALDPLISLYTEADEPLFDIIENAILAIRPVKIEPFIKIFQSPENTDSMKLSALHLLGRLGNPDTALFLLKNFHDFHDHLKPALIRTMGILKDERALPLLHASLLPEPGEISQETGAEESTGAVEDIQMTALEALVR